ncbi:MAG: MFS transporter, partial [Deltaproteobacteria bacterium]|nr:MFS transporter [Deltaproteobacteria bacterium]
VACWIVGLGLLGTHGPDTPLWALVASLVPVGIGVAAAFVFPWAALPEVIDVDRLVNDRSQEGVFTGVMTFLRKASTTGALFLLSLALEWSGYTSSGPEGVGLQPPGAATTIRLVTTVIPALLVLVAAGFAWRYPITRRLYRLVRRRLDRPAEQPAAERRELERELERVC